MRGWCVPVPWEKLVWAAADGRGPLTPKGVSLLVQSALRRSVVEEGSRDARGEMRYASRRLPTSDGRFNDVARSMGFTRR
ncbi:hypothetical protein IF2G_04576 [Cordyceps javanica]|nr:hypothetical protein IF2G_04576 [Cordyceps javanica]